MATNTGNVGQHKRSPLSVTDRKRKSTVKQVKSGGGSAGTSSKKGSIWNEK